jgi:uncharacterized Zn ribbon protein
MASLIKNITASIEHCEPIKVEATEGHTYESLMRFTSFSAPREEYTHRSKHHYTNVGHVSVDSLEFKTANALGAEKEVKNINEALVDLCNKIFRECNGVRLENGDNVDFIANGPCRSLSVGDIIKIRYFVEGYTRARTKIFAVADFGWDVIEEIDPNQDGFDEMYSLEDPTDAMEKMGYEECNAWWSNNEDKAVASHKAVAKIEI